MASDEAGAIKTMEFQKEVLTEFNNHLVERQNVEKPYVDQAEVEKREEELKQAALDWCEENDVEPMHLQNSMNRYSTNFSPAAGGRPLILVEDPEAYDD